MSPQDERLQNAIAFLVRSRLGASARWRLHDRTPKSPMNFALDEALGQLGSDVAVVWVDGGHPDLFTITAPPLPVVVYSSRYVELTAFIRGLMADDLIAPMRVDLSERATLTILAELALLQRNVELAVRLFLRSKLGSVIHRPSRDILNDLELTPISERYMAAWFFGLVHEIGHSWRPSAEESTTGWLSTEALEAALLRSLDNYQDELEVDLSEILGPIRLRDPDHPLAIVHVRDEVSSDLFAVSVLLQATINLLKQDLNPQAVIAEMYFYMNVISHMERCKSILRAATTTLRPVERERLLLQPVALRARLDLVMQYLTASFVARYADDAETEDVRAERTGRWHDVVYETMQHFSQATREVDTGLGNAMKVAVTDREPLPVLLARAGDENGDSPIFGLEVRDFIDLADTTGLDGEPLLALSQHAV